ncbi:MAG: hypothetical protein ACOC38_08685, partial [Promethearchaeia archaeon]
PIKSRIPRTVLISVIENLRNKKNRASQVCPNQEIIFPLTCERSHHRSNASPYKRCIMSILRVMLG